MHGVEVKPHDAMAKVDVFFNALHGEYGEDGKIQKFWMITMPATPAPARSRPRWE